MEEWGLNLLLSSAVVIESLSSRETSLRLASGGGGVASFLEDVARRLDAVSDRLQAFWLSCRLLHADLSLLQF